MMSLTFGLFTQVSGSGPLGPLVFYLFRENKTDISCESSARHRIHMKHQASYFQRK